MSDRSLLDKFRAAVHLRRGLAVTATVVAVLVSYSAILFGLNAGLQANSSETAGSILGVGIGFIPLVFALAALTTGHPRAILAVVKSVGLWLVATPLLFVDLILGLTAAYSLGLTTSLYHPNARWTSRLSVVAAVVILTALLLLIAPAAALFGPVIAAGPAIALNDDRAELFKVLSR